MSHDLLVALIAEITTMTGIIGLLVYIWQTDKARYKEDKKNITEKIESTEMELKRQSESRHSMATTISTLSIETHALQRDVVSLKTSIEALTTAIINSSFSNKI